MKSIFAKLITGLYLVFFIVIACGDETDYNSASDQLKINEAGIRSPSIDYWFVPSSPGDVTGTLVITESATVSPYNARLTGIKGNVVGPDIGSNTILPHNLIASGLIIADGESDIVISGSSISNSRGNCVEIINGSANITIENSKIGPCGKNGIDIQSGSHSITIKNNHIHDTKGDGIFAYLSESIEVTNNQIERVATGVYVENSTQIHVNNNTIRNVQGPSPRGQLVLFAYVKGAGNRITNNIGVNELGASYAEDAINLYQSHGLPDDLIEINNNMIIGGGPSSSGGGILLGDGGGSSSYQIAKDNILINPGQYGVAISGGHHQSLVNNIIYSKQFSFTNVGLYVWDQYNSNCSDIVVRNNVINWTDKDGKKNGFWDGGNCGSIEGRSTNDWKADIKDTIEGNR